MLFIHDHTFLHYKDTFYTTGSLNDQVMGRYKQWFGRVDVFATTRDVTQEDTAFLKEENSVHGIFFHLIPKKRNILGLLQSIKPLKIEVKKADCIVIRMSLLGALGVYYAKKYKKPYLVEMVACPWDSLWNHSIKGKILAPFMTVLTKYVCKCSPYVLYVTNEFLQNRYPSKHNSIGCSDVELTNIDNAAFEQRLSMIDGLQNISHLRIGTVANVAVRYKDQELVIRSLKKLNEHGIHCDYYLIGGGSPDYLQQVAKQEDVSHQVHFVGPVPHEDIFCYADKLDLYVQPSLQEGLPRAVIEVMSRGCPVIGSSAGGIPELIDDDCVFKKGNRSSFVTTVLGLSKDKMKRMASHNFAKSKEYDKAVLDRRREQFYVGFYQSSVKGIEK